jgi:hypothetical protein
MEVCFTLFTTPLIVQNPKSPSKTTAFKKRGMTRADVRRWIELHYSTTFFTVKRFFVAALLM